MIESIFNDLDPYLRGVKKADGYSIVEVHLKKSWLIPEHGTTENQNKILKDNIMYYMFYSEVDSFDDIINWLKKDVIEMNLEVEQKEELLKQKVAQLKEVFETSSLEDLKNLKFSSENDVLKLNGNKKNKTEKTEKKKEKVEEKVES